MQLNGNLNSVMETETIQKNGASMKSHTGKRLLVAFLAVMLLSTISAWAQFSGGSGTQQNPYQISSKADMETLATAVKNGNTFSGKYFLLTQDLKLFNTVTTVIGTSSTNCFSGNFDGGGHEITMSLNTNGNVGIFGFINNANIQNLSINGNISVSTTNHNLCGGGICAIASNSTITNCYNVVDISVIGNSFYLGGICGSATNSTITNCYNAGNISVNTTTVIVNNFNNWSGGICANASNSSITACYNTGDIVVTSACPYAGGICASSSNCIITNCYNMGNASASSRSNGNPAYAGGICAYASSSSMITNSYNTGDMSSSSGYQPHSGGICARGTDIKIENCFAANTKILSTYLGRIFGGGNNVSLANCYALSSMLLNNYIAFTENTANEKNGQDIDIQSLQSQNWITQNLGWNFATVWKQKSNQFPVLYYYKYPSVIAFSLPAVTYGAQIALNAVSDNTSVPIIYETSDNAIAEISGNTLIAKKAGDVTITASQAANNDYSAGSTPVNLTIQKRTLTVTANPASMTYGDAVPAFTCSYSGFVNNETETVFTQQPVFSCNASSASNAGTYTITPSGAAAQNYGFSYQSGALTINKRSLAVRPNDKTRLYGDANPTFDLIYTGFVNGNTASNVSIQLTATTAANAGSPVGEYPIVLAGGSAQNYELALMNGAMNITKAPLTITADDKMRIYGESNPLFTLSYSGFKNSENESVLDILPAISCNAGQNSPAGFYEIVLSGGSDNNYSYNLVNGMLEIATVNSLDDVSVGNIKIYPNPVINGVLTVENGDLITGATVYDLQGNAISSFRLQTGTNTINVSHLTAGVYMVKIENYIGKFVKK